MHFREVRTETPSTANNGHRLDFPISYVNASKEQLRSVVESSSYCSYTFKYECHSAVLTHTSGLETYHGMRYYDRWADYTEGMCNGKNHGHQLFYCYACEVIK